MGGFRFMKFRVMRFRVMRTWERGESTGTSRRLGQAPAAARIGALLSGVLASSSCLLGPAPAQASNHLLFKSGVVAPLGTSADFADNGTDFELRWRHFNRGRSAYEFVVGFSQTPLDGEVQSTIADFERLVRMKNLLAQQQGGDGVGTILAEFGTLDVYYVNANFNYRFFRRTRVAPFASVGAGLYNWRLPFRVKFFNVPSFGEQNAWERIGGDTDQQYYAYVFPEQSIDFTKHKTSGGLNVAVGADLRLTRTWAVEIEGRAHLIFSSGRGTPEVGSDDQEYLDNMTFFVANAALSYRF